MVSFSFASPMARSVSPPSSPASKAARQSGVFQHVQRWAMSLALLCLRLQHGRPLRFGDDTDWGPYSSWVRPLLLLEAGRREAARAALRRTPVPTGDLLMEAMWALTGRAAVTLGDKAMMRKVEAALAPAIGEPAGAGSGMLTVGPVSRPLDAFR